MIRFNLQYFATTKDLSTLGLSSGTHTIKVKAKGTGYSDSDFSNEVSYTVASGYSVLFTFSYDYENSLSNCPTISLEVNGTTTEIYSGSGVPLTVIGTALTNLGATSPSTNTYLLSGITKLIFTETGRMLDDNISPQIYENGSKTQAIFETTTYTLTKNLNTSGSDYINFWCYKD